CWRARHPPASRRRRAPTGPTSSWRGQASSGTTVERGAVKGAIPRSEKAALRSGMAALAGNVFRLRLAEHLHVAVPDLRFEILSVVFGEVLAARAPALGVGDAVVVVPELVGQDAQQLEAAGGGGRELAADGRPLPFVPLVPLLPSEEARGGHAQAV